jgi:hypothetical protein
MLGDLRRRPLAEGYGETDSGWEDYRFSQSFFVLRFYSFESSVVMGVVSKSGSGGISRICPLFSPTTDIRRGERHVCFVPGQRLMHCSNFDAVSR